MKRMTSDDHDLYIEAIGKLSKAKQNEIAELMVDRSGFIEVEKNET